jgi:SAM-dependent methyltransferase
MNLCSTPRRLDGGYEEFTIGPKDPEIHLEGGWKYTLPLFEKKHGEIPYSEGYSDDIVVLDGIFSDVAVRLYCHQWGGNVDLFLDDVFQAEITTYRPRWGTTMYFEIARNLPLTPHRVVLRPSKNRAADALGRQVFFREFIVTAPQGAYAGRERAIPGELYRSNRHDHRLTAVRVAVDPDGSVLEVGGGDRFIDDSRYLNTEYNDSELPGVLCDALALPFKTDSFDAVVSQAVIEHVTDPKVYAAEIERVTKPGGAIWVGGAFMQPVHLAPYHFFNVTPFGMRHLFGHLDNFQQNYNGNLAGTIDWMIDSLPKPQRFLLERDKLKSVAKEIERQLTQNDMMNVASGVVIEGRKSKLISHH